MSTNYRADRRLLLKTGALAGTALAAGTSKAIAQLANASHPTAGDVAILRFLSAVEQIESDLWLQYAELGGVQDSELPGLTGGNGPYTAALKNLDGDMDQYIHDNTEDEFSHHAFLNAFLQSIGAQPVDLSQFATLTTTSSTAAGSSRKPRLTNLTQLTVDTSWWTRYRSRDFNPDLDPNHVFPQAVASLNTGQHTAIPRTNADTTNLTGIQSIANTAAFHFAFIEQGGTSLYPTLALNVTDATVLRILLSIGPTETMHFQTWQDKAGNGVSTPLAPLTFGSLTFPDLNSSPFGGEDFQTNLIMPEPCPFLSHSFPKVSVIRPVSISGTTFGPKVVVKAFTDDGLFIGQSKAFFKALNDLAQDAESARRHC